MGAAWSLREIRGPFRGKSAEPCARGGGIQANGVLGSLVPPRSPCLVSPSCGGNQKVHPGRIANRNAVGPCGGKRL